MIVSKHKTAQQIVNFCIDLASIETVKQWMIDNDKSIQDCVKLDNESIEIKRKIQDHILHLWEHRKFDDYGG